MLIVDFSKDIGYMWKTDSDGNLQEEYRIYYSSNSLFAICDMDKNLVSFAVDLDHLQNELGLSKAYKGQNCFEGFSFSFTYYPNYDKDVRVWKVFTEIANLFFKKVKTNYFTFTVVAHKGDSHQ